jgi:hypothetical protein
MSDQNAMLKMLYEDHKRLSRTETREVPGAIPGFTSFYDTGVFTPTFVGSTIAGTFTYDAANTGGIWSRIGNQVFVEGRVRITAIAVAPTGNLQIGGLPITSATTGRNIAGALTFGAWTGITLTGARTMLAAVIVDTVLLANLFESGSNIAVNVTQGAALVLVGGIADIRFSGNYTV